MQQREAQKLDQIDNIQVIYDYYKKYQKRLDIANLEEEEREWQQENTSSGGMPKLYYSYFLWSLSSSSSFSLFLVSPPIRLFSLRLQFVVIVASMAFFSESISQLNKMCCWHLLFIEKCFDVVDKSGDQRG